MPDRRERRGVPRLRSRRFATPFGEVVDVSGTGMAVLHRGPRVAVGQTLRLSIAWTGRLVAVDCAVTRVERAGFRRQTVGLRWLEPPEGLWAWLRDRDPRRGTECAGPWVYMRRTAA